MNQSMFLKVTFSNRKNNFSLDEIKHILNESIQHWHEHYYSHAKGLTIKHNLLNYHIVENNQHIQVWFDVYSILSISSTITPFFWLNKYYDCFNDEEKELASFVNDFEEEFHICVMQHYASLRKVKKIAAKFIIKFAICYQ